MCPSLAAGNQQFEIERLNSATKTESSGPNSDLRIRALIPSSPIAFDFTELTAAETSQAVTGSSSSDGARSDSGLERYCHFRSKPVRNKF